VNAIGRVRARQMKSRVHALRNLPVTTCQDLTGIVSSVSTVPPRTSSLQRRMVIAGTRKMKVQGTTEKKKSMLAVRWRKKSWLSKNHQDTKAVKITLKT
jgi:hypothetical protein